MRQFEIDYYKQVVEKQYNDFISNVVDDTISGIDKEVLCRNIVSRAYYCSLLYCRENTPIVIGQDGTGSHELIINQLGNYFKTRVNRLKNHRVKADYKTNNFNTHARFIEKMYNHMNEVLSASQHDLLNKT